ncbi:MAG: ankyrin repeat domain-containing protein [Bryobacteraceae bacterium]
MPRRASSWPVGRIPPPIATPLSLACTNGNAAMIEMLLAAGADPNRGAAGR